MPRLKNGGNGSPMVHQYQIGSPFLHKNGYHQIPRFSCEPFADMQSFTHSFTLKPITSPAIPLSSYPSPGRYVSRDISRSRRIPLRHSFTTNCKTVANNSREPKPIPRSSNNAQARNAHSSRKAKKRGMHQAVGISTSQQSYGYAKRWESVERPKSDGYAQRWECYPPCVWGRDGGWPPYRGSWWPHACARKWDEASKGLAEAIGEADSKSASPADRGGGRRGGGRRKPRHIKDAAPAETGRNRPIYKGRPAAETGGFPGPKTEGKKRRYKGRRRNRRIQTGNNATGTAVAIATPQRGGPDGG